MHEGSLLSQACPGCPGCPSQDGPGEGYARVARAPQALARGPQLHGALALGVQQRGRADGGPASGGAQRRYAFGAGNTGARVCCRSRVLQPRDHSRARRRRTDGALPIPAPVHRREVRSLPPSRADASPRTPRFTPSSNPCLASALTPEFHVRRPATPCRSTGRAWPRRSC
eukprot:5955713-Prymnesium_polylepis.1